MGTVVSIELATTVGTFVSGFIVNTAIGVGLAFYQTVVFDALADEPLEFNLTWADWLFIGFGALMVGPHVSPLPEYRARVRGGVCAPILYNRARWRTVTGHGRSGGRWNGRRPRRRAS